MGTNKAYSLSESGDIIARYAAPEELSSAREAAKSKMVAMRSCWNCNSAHAHFLDDLNDGFLFCCIGDCGRWYYQGIDITDETP